MHNSSCVQREKTKPRIHLNGDLNTQNPSTQFATTFGSNYHDSRSTPFFFLSMCILFLKWFDYLFMPLFSK